VELPALPVHLTQPLFEIIDLRLLNPFDRVKLGEVVSLEPVQARQFPSVSFALAAKALAAS
jgi:hypothetical protein